MCGCGGHVRQQLTCCPAAGLPACNRLVAAPLLPPRPSAVAGECSTRGTGSSTHSSACARAARCHLPAPSSMASSLLDLDAPQLRQVWHGAAAAHACGCSARAHLAHTADARRPPPLHGRQIAAATGDTGAALRRLRAASRTLRALLPVRGELQPLNVTLACDTGAGGAAGQAERRQHACMHACASAAAAVKLSRAPLSRASASAPPQPQAHTPGLRATPGRFPSWSGCLPPT